MRLRPLTLSGNRRNANVDIPFLRTWLAVEKHRHEYHDQQHQHDCAHHAAPGFLFELQLFVGDGSFSHVGERVYLLEL